jgi:hypothetical protein
MNILKVEWSFWLKNCGRSRVPKCVGNKKERIKPKKNNNRALLAALII